MMDVLKRKRIAECYRRRAREFHDQVLLLTFLIDEERYRDDFERRGMLIDLRTAVIGRDLYLSKARDLLDDKKKGGRKRA